MEHTRSIIGSIFPGVSDPKRKNWLLLNKGTISLSHSNSPNMNPDVPPLDLFKYSTFWFKTSKMRTVVLFYSIFVRRIWVFDFFFRAVFPTPNFPFPYGLISSRWFFFCQCCCVSRIRNRKMSIVVFAEFYCLTLIRVVKKAMFLYVCCFAFVWRINVNVYCVMYNI